MGVGPRRRNSEKRKEKSRDAARNRRGKESEIFNDLASQLPMSANTIEQLDKASVMRLLLSTVKISTIMNKRPRVEVCEEGSLEEKIDTFYTKALEGFLLVLSKDGDFIYVSDTVSKYLGIQQIDLMGQSIFEFSHPCDHEEIQEMLSPHHRDAEDDMQAVSVRLKCTLTSKGRNVNLKSASYKVIRMTGKFILDNASEESEDEREEEAMEDDEEEREVRSPRACNPKKMPHLIAIGETIPHPSNIEVPLDKRTFTSRHSMNMKFTDCDDRIKRLIGFHNEEMTGHSFFSYHHALDSKMMEKSFKDLFSKGQTTTGQYRFLAKHGGYVWMVTQATIIYNNRTQKPQCVVCVHYVLSHVEQHGRILAQVQIPVEVKKEEPITRIQCQMPVIPKVVKQQEQKMAELLHVPIFSTEDVFSEKTDDMDKEFYFPPGVKKTLKNSKEPDLSHLAPRDGNVCIPLGRPRLYSMKEVESFGTNLNLYDDYANIDRYEFKTEMPVMRNGKHVVVTKDSKHKMRDTTQSGYSTGNSSPNTSPTHLLGSTPGQSPNGYLSTINPLDISAMESMFTTINTENEEETEDIDFTLRAPFIPMTADEDFNLIQPSNELLLNMGADFNPGIYGCTESVFKLKDELYDGPPTEKSKTPLEMIGGSTVKASIEQPEDMMNLKLKRPLNKSCLEKGPPVKIRKYGPAVSLGNCPHVQEKHTTTKDSSVLMNLLLKGEDKDNGYSAVTIPNISGKSNDRQSEILRHLLKSVPGLDFRIGTLAVNRHLQDRASVRLNVDD